MAPSANWTITPSFLWKLAQLLIIGWLVVLVFALMWEIYGGIIAATSELPTTVITTSMAAIVAKPWGNGFQFRALSCQPLLTLPNKSQGSLYAKAPS